MAVRIRWTPIAVEDLTSVHDFIAAESRRYARIVIGEIRRRVRSIHEFPLAGRVVPEFDLESIRQVPAHNYRIIYRVHGENVDILGVVHGARDLESLWERDDRPLEQDESAQ